MVPKTLLLVASLMGAALAAPQFPGAGGRGGAAKPSKPCKPSSSTSTPLAPASTTSAVVSAVTSDVTSAVVTPTTVADTVATPTLPSTGATDLPNPPEGVVLKHIAVGHGLQNYTCANATGTATATGALAVLYDITSLYPGTAGTGLTEEGFAGLSSTVLFSQAIPLNLADPTAADPATPALPEASYGAAFPPFGAPADLSISGMDPISFLGVHYFDAAGSPTFDLSAGGLFFSAAKAGGVKAPADADKGILATGAVDWLQLGDSGKGLSSGVSLAYRVVTAGGVAQTCDVSGAGAGSVPYTAQYWFFGPAE